MSHYEKLGVDEKATQADIKRAYRKKANKLHPDKGGNAAKFAEVANAYEVLKDPDRRMLYDATGEDTEKLPIEVEVHSVLSVGFAAALQSDKDIAIVDYVRNGLKMAAGAYPEQIKKLKKRRASLEKKRKNVKVADTVNLVHTLIDSELAAIDAGLREIDHTVKINKACLEELEKYSEEWKEPKAPTGGVYFRTVRFDFDGGSII